MGVAHTPWMRTAPYEKIEYDLRPHYKWFPCLWYDVIKNRWWTDGTHVPIREVEVLRNRVRSAEANAFIKLLKG
jgi:hypothetical protein